MPALKDPRRERYARFRARGFTQKESYYKAGYNGAWGDSAAAHVEESPHVRARIQELIAENRQLNDMSRAEMIDFLNEVISSPIGTVDENSRIAQEVEEIGLSDGRRRKRVKACDKLHAMRLLAQITGRSEPEVIEVRHTGEIKHIVDATLMAQLQQGYRDLHIKRIQAIREVEALPDA